MFETPSEEAGVEFVMIGKNIDYTGIIDYFQSQRMGYVLIDHLYLGGHSYSGFSLLQRKRSIGTLQVKISYLAKFPTPYGQPPSGIIGQYWSA